MSGDDGVNGGDDAGKAHGSGKPSSGGESGDILGAGDDDVDGAGKYSSGCDIRGSAANRNLSWSVRGEDVNG